MTVYGLIQQKFTHAQVPIFSQSWEQVLGTHSCLLAKGTEKQKLELCGLS